MALGIVAAALAGALIAVGPHRARLPATPAARDAFDRGRTAFGRAEYQRAIEVLHPLLYPEVLLDSEGEVVQARRMLGVAYLFENKPDEARREFRKLLELRPDYRFDPLLDPQRVVDFFNGVLKEEEATIAEIEKRRRERRQEARGRSASATPRGCACRRPSSATNGIRSRSTSSRSAPASSRTASGARAGCSSARRRCWARCRSGRSRPTSGSTAWRRSASASTPSRRASRARRDRSITRRKTRPTCCSAFRSSAAGCSSPSRSGASSTPSITTNPRCRCRIGAKVARERSPAARLTFSPNGLGAAWAF